MSARGAPVGNQNGKKGSEWRDAIHWALNNHVTSSVKRGQALREIAIGVVDRALQGDKDCWQEIGNRLDGKPTQAIEAGDGDVIMLIKRVVAEPDYIEGETVNEALPDQSSK